MSAGQTIEGPPGSNPRGERFARKHGVDVGFGQGKRVRAREGLRAFSGYIAMEFVQNEPDAGACVYYTLPHRTEMK